MTELRHTIEALGYRLAEDASSEHGRLTFLHDDNADRPFLLALTNTLRYAGWRTTESIRTFVLPGTLLKIEIEPGGAETLGHYLHLIERD